eukprot:6213876-Pleurochrysis_carterae.AAC.1
MPVLLPCTGLQSRAVASGMPDEAAGSAPVVNGQCDWRPSALLRRTLPLRSSRSCIHAASVQRRSQAPAAPPPLAFLTPPSRLLPGRAAQPANRGVLASKGQEQHN